MSAYNANREYPHLMRELGLKKVLAFSSRFPDKCMNTLESMMELCHYYETFSVNASQEFVDSIFG